MERKVRFVSLEYYSIMDIETVAGRLGHSTSATTQNVYSHFLESKDREAAKMIEKAYGKKKTPVKLLKDAE